LAIHVFVCDFLAISLRRMWYSTSRIAIFSDTVGSWIAACSKRTVRSTVSSGVFF
jgi:hypothetical protein